MSTSVRRLVVMFKLSQGCVPKGEVSARMRDHSLHDLGFARPDTAEACAPAIPVHGRPRQDLRPYRAQRGPAAGGSRLYGRHTHQFRGGGIAPVGLSRVRPPRVPQGVVVGGASHTKLPSPPRPWAPRAHCPSMSACQDTHRPLMRAPDSLRPADARHKPPDERHPES